MGKYGGQTMEHEELNKKECNENSDRFIKDALNEETKKRKYRQHFEQILQLNPNTVNWDVVLNGQLIDHYETKEEAEETAEKLSFIYNFGLFEGINQGKELQQKHDKEGHDVGIALSIFETEND